MRKRAVRTLLAPLVLLALLPLASPPADAALIYTAKLDEVARQASHVCLAEWRPPTGDFRAIRWYRGTWPTRETVVRGIPGFVRRTYEPGTTKVEAPLPGPPVEDVITRRVVLFAEAVDGRLHLTGYRRHGKGFGAHASIRLLSKTGRVLRMQQWINPGMPQPVVAEATPLDAFETLLARTLEAHPYERPPGDRPEISPEARESFFAALGEEVDWYQGAWHRDLWGWGQGQPDLATILAIADRLEDWMNEAPKAEKIHALDGMMMLCRKIQGGGEDTSSVLRLVGALLDDVEAAVAEAWILRELEHGGSYVNREGFGRLARRLGPETYEKALQILERWVERQASGVGCSCWSALHCLGHGNRAEAATARREAREAAEEGAEDDAAK